MTRYYLFALLLVTLTSQANAPQQGDTVKQHRSNSQQPAASRHFHLAGTEREAGFSRWRDERLAGRYPAHGQK